MPDETSRRVFFAFVPGAEATADLAAQIKTLRGTHDRRLRWLRPDGWHITLRFVGDVSAETLDRLSVVLQDAAQSHAGFEMVLSAIRVFPSVRRPLVLAAVGDAPVQGAGLAADLETRCRDLGLPHDVREWRPHLSLARIRGRQTLDVRSQSVSVAFDVRTVCLMESITSHLGAQYVQIAQASLRS